MATQITEERAVTWTGNIGLIQSSDFARANSNVSLCGTSGLHNTNRTTCITTNYLIVPSSSYSTITPSTYYVLGINGYVGLLGSGEAEDSAWPVYPALYLDPNIALSSSAGTRDNPYTIRGPGETDVNVSINSALALEVSTPELILEPVVNSGTEKEDLVVNVSTNDVVGYKLMMSSISNDTNLNHLSISGYSIPSTTNLRTSNLDLGDNTWGYNTGQASSTTAFGKIPSLSTPDTLKTTSGLALQDETPVTFGVKANMDTVAGTYMNSVIFTVLANL